MADDMTRGDGIRERGDRAARGTREADARRDGVKGNGMSPGTRATDPTGSAGTGAPIVAGQDTPADRTDGRVDGRSMGFGDGPGRGTGEGRTKASVPGGSHSTGSALLPHDESDKLTTRLQHAVGGFVDEPRSAVEEADHVLEAVTARFTEAMTQRRRTLRTSWQTTADDRGATDTEQLRLALRDYRELTERLLRL